MFLIFDYSCLSSDIYCSKRLKVLVIVLNGHVLGLDELALVLGNELRVDLELGSLGVFTEEYKVWLVG